jgi:hypothetical protein
MSYIDLTVFQPNDSKIFTLNDTIFPDIVKNLQCVFNSWTSKTSGKFESTNQMNVTSIDQTLFQNTCR